MTARRWHVLVLVCALAHPAAARAQSPDQTGDLPAAYLRRAAKKGSGKFYTAADVAKLGSTDVAQMLARVSGGMVRDVGGGEVAIVGRRGPRNQMGSGENELCRVGISVNESRLPDGFDIRGIKAEGIVAIEFYSGPSTTPPELNATGADAGQCGLIVLWLKGR